MNSKRNRVGTFAVVAGVALITVGCGRLIQPTRHVIHVVTDPPGATVRAPDGVEALTPGDLSVPRGEYFMILRVEKEGYPPACVMVEGRNNPVAMAGDILLIGIPLALDRTVTYPDRVDIALRRDSQSTEGVNDVEIRRMWMSYGVNLCALNAPVRGGEEMIPRKSQTARDDLPVISDDEIR